MVNLRRTLWHLLGGTRGGPLRIRILGELRDRPYNTNQLAVGLGADYKTIQHHLRVLVENRLVEPHGQGYGAVFFLTRDMEESLPELEAIQRRVRPPGKTIPNPPGPMPPEERHE